MGEAILVGGLIGAGMGSIAGGIIGYGAARTVQESLSEEDRDVLDRRTVCARCIGSGKVCCSGTVAGIGAGCAQGAVAGCICTGMAMEPDAAGLPVLLLACPMHACCVPVLGCGWAGKEAAEWAHERELHRRKKQHTMITTQLSASHRRGLELFLMWQLRLEGGKSSVCWIPQELVVILCELCGEKPPKRLIDRRIALNCNCVEVLCCC
eukprot:Hpha_TRINITY_DN16307_c2_g9::TRINITY_DN16307_c2_g9_i1::g.59379::m.59379